jgi:hypothetical protein
VDLAVIGEAVVDSMAGLFAAGPWFSMPGVQAKPEFDFNRRLIMSLARSEAKGQQRLCSDLIDKYRHMESPAWSDHRPTAFFDGWRAFRYDVMQTLDLILARSNDALAKEQRQ